MSTAPPATAHRSDAGHVDHGPERLDPVAAPVALPGVLRSEWVKLRSVRSTTTSLLATVGVLLFFGAVVAAVSGGLLATTGEGEGGPVANDPTAIALAGVIFAPLVIGVLGVMTATSEYATGTIGSTMTLVPRRLPVLWAKAAVLVVVTLPVMVVACLGAFLTGQLLLDAGGELPGAALTDPGVLRAVLGTAAYLSGVSVLGLSIGMLVRSTSVAVSALLTLVFLLPGLGGFLLPASWQDNVLLYLPSEAASAFTSVAPAPGLLGTTAGAAVFAAWVAVPLLVAAVALRRRPV